MRHAILVIALLFFGGLSSASTSISPRLDIIKKIYGITIWPTNENVLYTLYPNLQPRPPYFKNTPLPDVLDPLASGRVYPFREFTGPSGVLEYFYALTPNKVTFLLPGELTSEIADVYVREYFEYPIRVHDEHKHRVEYRAFSIIDYIITAFNNTSIFYSNSSQWGMWRFTSENKVLEFNNMQPFYSKQIREGVAYQYPGGFDNLTYQNTIINETCYYHGRFCLGSNVQYANEDICINFMKSIRFGQPDVEVGNDVICRRRHATLTVVNPDTHCMHVGPTGGGQCIDTPTSDLYVPYPNFAGDPYRISGAFAMDSVSGTAPLRPNLPKFPQ